MEGKQSDQGDGFTLGRRRVLRTAAAVGVAGGVGFGSGVAAGQDLDNLCKAVPLDVVLVLDRSGSMGFDPDGDGSSKLDDLKAAATGFVNRLTTTDRVGLVSFATNVSTDLNLTDDFSSAKSEINNLSAGGITNLGGGVDAGQNELDTNGRRDATPILVVLSNGLENTGPDAVAEAQEAKNAGIRVMTIALGDGADDAGLREMASMSKEDNFFDAAEGADLEDVFQAITQQICPLVVDIDIKPGSDPNALNCGAEGVVPVGILTTDQFDALDVDPTTLRFGTPSEIIDGEGATIAHTPFPTSDHAEDLDDDGDTDLATHYPIPDTSFTKDSSEGWLVGETTDGRAIAGRDSVKIVGNCK